MISWDWHWDTSRPRRNWVQWVSMLRTLLISWEPTILIGCNSTMRRLLMSSTVISAETRDGNQESRLDGKWFSSLRRSKRRRRRLRRQLHMNKAATTLQFGDWILMMELHWPRFGPPRSSRTWGISWGLSRRILDPSIRNPSSKKQVKRSCSWEKPVLMWNKQGSRCRRREIRGDILKRVVVTERDVLEMTDLLKERRSSMKDLLGIRRETLERRRRWSRRLKDWSMKSRLRRKRSRMKKPGTWSDGKKWRRTRRRSWRTRRTSRGSETRLFRIWRMLRGILLGFGNKRKKIIRS